MGTILVGCVMESKWTEHRGSVIETKWQEMGTRCGDHLRVDVDATQCKMWTPFDGAGRPRKNFLSEFAQNCPNCPDFPIFAQNCPKKPKIAQNCPKCPELSKMPRIAQISV